MENKFDQGPSTTIPGTDIKTHGSVRIIDTMVQEPDTTTSTTAAEEKDAAHYKQIDSFAVVYHKGEEVEVKATVENNGSVWTKYGYSPEADPRCGADEEKCGNDVIIKLGGKVLGVVKNVEGASDKTSKLDVHVSSKELDAIAEKSGLHDGEAIKGDATLRYPIWSSLKGEDVEIKTHVAEPVASTTTTEAAPSTTTTEASTTSTTASSTSSTAHHASTTTSISIPGNPTELAYTGDNTGMITGIGSTMLAAGLLMSSISKRVRAARN